MREVKKLCKEMVYGIAAWSALMIIVLTIAALFLRINPFAMALGVIVGGLTAVGLLFHMYRHLDIALDMEPKGASRHTQFAAVQRMMIMAVVMAAAFLFMDYLHPAGVAFGILGMKMAALFYPKIHIYFEKRKV